MSDFMVPDMIEPVIAWRTWRVDESGLRSYNQATQWPVRERLRAHCSNSEPSTRHIVGWEAVSHTGEVAWIRDALEGEQLVAPYFSTSPVYGLTGPTGVTYHPTAVSYSSVSTVISTVGPEPFELPTSPSGLALPQGWEWRIGHRQEQYPPVHTASPAEECSCGIYALKSRDMNTHYMPGADAWGEVYLWGKVIEGEFGYRAQYAYPKNLTTRVYFARLEKYGIPLEQEGVVQVAIQRALPTGPSRKGIRIGIAVNLAAFAFNLLLAAFAGVSVLTIVCLFINVIVILSLMILSALMSR